MTGTKGGSSLGHIPNNAFKFEFDEELAVIFDDMAVRSIPLYQIAQDMAVSMCVKQISDRQKNGQETHIIDIGASTGAFCKSLWKRLGYPLDVPIPGVNVVAIDKSTPMVERVEKELPQVVCINGSVNEVDRIGVRFDFIYSAYVMQFVEPSLRTASYSSVANAAESNAVLFMSHKEKVNHRYADDMHSMYMDFRLSNGYSWEEIEAKNLALSNAMWPQTRADVYGTLASMGFHSITEVCRWLQFSSFVGVKL